MQLEIAHAFPYTITILHVQGCVTKVMVIGIHSLMKTQYIGYHKKGIKVKRLTMIEPVTISFVSAAGSFTVGVTMTPIAIAPQNVS